MKLRTPARRLFLSVAVLVSFAAAAPAQRWAPTGPTGVAMVTAISSGRTAIYASTCNGVYRSDDGASSWREAGLQRRCVVRLAVDPRGSADTLYAIVDTRFFVSIHPEPSYMAIGDLFLDSELWVSRDGGQTWNQSPAYSGHWVAVDPTEPDTAYLANYDATNYPLAVTHDSGATWTRVPDVPDETLYHLAVDSRDGTLYGTGFGFLASYAGGRWSSQPMQAAAVAAGSGSDGAVYAAGYQTFCRRTTAADWTCKAGPTNVPINILEFPGPPTQKPRILLLSLDAMYASDDGGETFLHIGEDVAGYAPAAALDPSGTVVYAGNDVGVYRSPDRGATWTNSSAGLSSMWIRALSLDPSDPSTIWAGGEGRISDVYDAGPGLFRSTDAGQTWTSASVSGVPGYVFSLAVDPASPRHIYTGSFGRVHYTSDGGGTWSESKPEPSLGFIHALDVDPSSSKIWAGANRSLSASNDGGTTWSKVLSDDVFCLLFDPRQPDRIYAGSNSIQGDFDYPYGSGWATQTSNDRGVTWFSAGGPAGAGVTALALDPFSQDVLYAGTFLGEIYRSADGGSTWTRRDTMGTGDQVWALLADRTRPAVLYFGGWGGAYRSVDGGQTWDSFSEGLDPYGVFALAESPDGRFLYAGTTGGGVFRVDLDVSDREPLPLADESRKTRTVGRHE